MTDKPYQANDPEQVKKRADKAKLRREQQHADLQELLALPSFRRYLWRHMHETCGLMRSGYSPNGTTQTLNVAMQDVAKALWVEVERVDPSMIPKMMVEYYEAQLRG